MVKNSIALFSIFIVFSCSKKRSGESLNEQNYVELQYDTTAVDSFSSGAISVDVAAQIRRSSVAYQDSIRQAKVAADIIKKEQEEKQKTESLEKEKRAAEKKITDQKNLDAKKAEVKAD